MILICPTCKRTHDNSKGECPFDWPGIRDLERRTREKADRLPKCRVCNQPMWLDQVGTHHSCRGS